MNEKRSLKDFNPKYCSRYSLQPFREFHWSFVYEENNFKVKIFYLFLEWSWMELIKLDN